MLWPVHAAHSVGWRRAARAEGSFQKGGKEKGDRPRGRALHHNWTIKPEHEQLAFRLGRSQKWLEDLAEEMRDWASANSNRGSALFIASL